MIKTSRLSYFVLAAALGSLVVAGQVGAQSSSEGNAVEWRERFDVSMPRTAPTRNNLPIAGTQSVMATEQAIQIYREIVAKGGWPKVPNEQTLRVGAISNAVSFLRQRLMVTGDLQEGTGGRPEVFDSFVETAVKKFQHRHGIVADGVVRKATYEALNVPAEQRLRQLELNLPRLKSLATNLGDRYVMMNIPSAELEAVQTGQVLQRHTTVIGKIDRQSPILAVKIMEVNFNPFWTVPLSIIKKDLIPKMQKDPEYLTTNRIRIFDNKGNELAPNWINWTTDEAINFRFRQDPSDLNSMGSVRIGMPNTESVYMHDTPQKSLFGGDARFHSSGCARVQNVRDLVTWLLAETPEWSRGRIDQAIRTDERIDVKLKKPVPVYWVYVTAWASGGDVNFREDVYSRDKAHLAGDYRLPATPFDQVGPQAFVPGMRSPVRGN